jgi:hypothetical protein
MNQSVTGIEQFVLHASAAVGSSLSERSSLKPSNSLRALKLVLRNTTSRPSHWLASAREGMSLPPRRESGCIDKNDVTFRRLSTTASVTTAATFFCLASPSGLRALWCGVVMVLERYRIGVDLRSRMNTSQPQHAHIFAYQSCQPSHTPVDT